MSSLSFVSSSIVYYLVFKVQPKTVYFLVGSSGLEPPTSRLSGVRSNHLSYEPISYPLRVVVEMNGIEPMTPCLQSRCSPS